MIIGKAIAQTGEGKNPLTHALAFNQNALTKMRQTLTVPMTDASVRRTTVKWIEASLWKDKDRLPWYVGSATVEHVLPRRTKPGSKWETDFPDEDQRYDCANSLGNLVALDWERNKALVNSEYSEKQPAYQPAPHFKTLAQVAVQPVWTAELIKKREDDLVQHIFAEMTLPTY